MATLKQRLHRKNAEGTYDVIHYETEAKAVIMDDGTTLQDCLDGLGNFLNEVVGTP